MPVDVIGFLLTCDSKPILGYFSGFYLRGLFYRVLKSFDPVMATRLHEYGGLAPFSMSTLVEMDNGAYFFRITSYSTRLSDAILRSFSRIGELKLVNNMYYLLEISCKRIDLDRLVRDSEPLKRYEIEFITPTCFRRPSPYVPLHIVGFLARIMKLMGRPKSHYRFFPLPDPILMFRNLKRQWDQYAGVTLRCKKFSRWLEEGGIAISGVSDVKTHRVVDRRKRFYVGFTGKVRVSLPEDTFSEENARAVNVLLKIGEETQVGINRTAGFGMYRILKAK
ncbi:MAG: CRISPR system precrRNA processing endoribonuclease RAMP protein Cas6 [Aigarchaeota archaeon]|nr:CRISPR system precrRNA processing endoribonuclease RAMP protein Cas6 [Aigarchaeota archaeon]